MICNKAAEISKENLTKEGREIYDRLERSWESYKKNELLRFITTGSKGRSNASQATWRAWVEDTLNTNFEHINVADARMIEAETRKIEKRIKSKIFKTEGSVKEFMLKVLTLPSDLWQAHGLGKQHEKMSIIDQQRQDRKAKFGSDLKSLRTKVQSLVGESLGSGENALRDAGVFVEEANANFKLLVDKRTNGEAVSDAQIEAARAKVNEAEANYDRVSYHTSKEAKNSSKVLRLIAEALNGDHGDLSKGVGKVAVKLSQKMDGAIKPEGFMDVLKDSRAVLDTFKAQMRDATGKIREALEIELSARMPAEEARKMASDIVVFKEIDNYYPNKSMVAMYQRIKGMMEAKKILASNKEDFAGQMNDLIASQKSAHQRIRKGSSELIDKNMLKVLEIYANEVADHAHAADMNILASKFVRDLASLDVMKKAVGNPNSSELAYMNSVKRLITAQMHQIFDRQASTFADEALGAISSFQVFSKLTNVSSTLNNRIEGVLQYMSNSGMQNVARLRELSKVHEKVINDALREANTDFTVDHIVDPSFNLANSKNISKFLRKTDIQDAEILRTEALTGHMSKFREVMGKVGGKGLKLVGWDRAENANRRESFMLGAAEAAEYLENVHKGRFMRGEINDYIVQEYNLDASKVQKLRKSKDQELAGELYNKFRNAYIIRMGFRSMFQSQFQYSESARNFMDLNAKTSWLTMFQHYPRSLGSAILWAMYDVKNLYEVAGVKGLVGQGSSKNLGRGKEGLTNGTREALAVNHRLQHVLTLGGISMIRKLVAANFGIVFFNVLEHPLANVMSDLYDYFVDDEPHSKREKAWDLLYGRNQPVRRFVGPAATEAMNLASIPASKMLEAMDGVAYGMVEAGIHDGSMASHLHQMLGATGMRTTDKSLTDKGRKQYSSALDIAKEHLLHSFAMYGKTQDLVNAAVSKQPKETMLQLGRMVGVRANWKVVQEDETM